MSFPLKLTELVRLCSHCAPVVLSADKFSAKKRLSVNLLWFPYQMSLISLLHCELFAVRSLVRVTFTLITMFAMQSCAIWEWNKKSRVVGFPEANKKAVLSQRWPRNAPYTWVPWKFSGLPDCIRPWLLFPTFSRAFVPIDPVNIATNFEVRSFIRSWDNRGYPKKLGSPWIRPRSLFSRIFNRLIGFYSDWPCKCTRQI